MRKRRIIWCLGLGLVLLGLAAASGRWLVVDDPQRADVILVLAGEMNTRPARGVELLNAGYAPRLIIDVPARERVYQWTAPDLAALWVKNLPRAQAISICPTFGFSTKEEAREAARCLERTGGKKALLVTSDFHTRRALSTFRHEVPGIDFHIAAAYDASNFGVNWWKDREWAKTNFYEWMRLLWWELVDRWR
jgi:hypothetical protein